MKVVPLSHFSRRSTRITYHIMHILFYIKYLVAVHASGGVVEAMFSGGPPPWHPRGGLLIGGLGDCINTRRSGSVRGMSFSDCGFCC